MAVNDLLKLLWLGLGSGFWTSVLAQTFAIKISARAVRSFPKEPQGAPWADRVLPTTWVTACGGRRVLQEALIGGCDIYELVLEVPSCHFHSVLGHWASHDAAGGDCTECGRQ